MLPECSSGGPAHPSPGGTSGRAQGSGETERESLRSLWNLRAYLMSAFPSGRLPQIVCPLLIILTHIDKILAVSSASA